ncbi:MAG TPA: hypothetical protein VN633_13355 [Bryobacteraceae bacterium]|nr:hypothetical protein [Bryobacteraceae bacterium]
MRLNFVWLLLACALCPLHADPLLERGYQEMYNLQFQAAHQTFAQFEKKNPADAMGPVSDAAAYLFGEFERLRILQSQFFTSNSNFFNFHHPKADPKIKQQFENALGRTKTLVDSMLKKSPTDQDALLAETLRFGLEANYLALIEKKNIAALNEIKDGRAAAQKLLASHPDCYDGYLAAGVENYLLSQKPAPVRWLLSLTGSETDKEQGIKDLRIVAEKGRYLLPYARLLLAIAALRDGNKARAHELLNWLSTRFPKNTLYREELKKIK